MINRHHCYIKTPMKRRDYIFAIRQTIPFANCEANKIN